MRRSKAGPSRRRRRRPSSATIARPMCGPRAWLSPRRASPARCESHPPQSPEILALNPFGKMPTYRCGELALYETSAIMRHLDETMPGPALMPTDPAERARAEQWISVLNCYGYPAIVKQLRAAIHVPARPRRQAGSGDDRRGAARNPQGVRRRSIGRSTRATIWSATLSRWPTFCFSPWSNTSRRCRRGRSSWLRSPICAALTDRLAQRPSYVAATQPPAV